MIILIRWHEVYCIKNIKIINRLQETRGLRNPATCAGVSGY